MFIYIIYIRYPGHKGLTKNYKSLLKANPYLTITEEQVLITNVNINDEDSTVLKEDKD